MTKSHTFATQLVNLSPVRIRFCCKKQFPVSSSTGNITSAWQKISPSFFITISYGVGIQEYIGHVILEVNAHTFTAFNKTVVERRDCRTEFCNSEKPILSSYTEWSNSILCSLIRACSIRIIKEPRECFPMLKRIIEGYAKFTLYLFSEIVFTELLQFIQNWFKGSSPLTKIFIFCKKPFVKLVFNYALEVADNQAKYNSKRLSHKQVFTKIKKDAKEGV